MLYLFSNCYISFNFLFTDKFLYVNFLVNNLFTYNVCLHDQALIFIIVLFIIMHIYTEV